MAEGGGRAPIEQPGLRTRMGHENRRISSQHRQLDSLYGMIVSALRRGSRDQAKLALERFHDAFDAHISLEDGFYFPAVRGMEPRVADELDSLSSEHERFRSQLAALAEAFESGSLSDAEVSLDEFVTGVAAHEGREDALLATLTGGAGDEGD